MKRFYEIKVYDGMELLFESRVPVGQISEKRLRDLLQALVLKHALTPEEIVDGHLNRNAPGYRALPEVRQDSGEGQFQLLCGDVSTPWCRCCNARPHGREVLYLVACTNRHL